MGDFARHCRSVAALLVCCGTLHAQSGASLLKGDPLACFTTLDGGPGNASLSTVAVDGQNFSAAWDLRTINAATNARDLRLRCLDTCPASKGDIIVVTFWMRTITPGEGQTQGNATFSILDYGPDVDVDRLNLPPPWPYPGHEPNALWRRKALDRIERIRKADVAVVLRDSVGKPLVGVPVHLQMKKHALGWGTVIDATQLSSNASYADAVRDNFNEVALVNDLTCHRSNRSRSTASRARIMAATAPKTTASPWSSAIALSGRENPAHPPARGEW